jgi:hypothetical protein
MRHAVGRGSAVPMLHAWRDPYDIARPDFLNRTIPLSDEADARSDDQGLTKRMGMPSSPCAGLARDDVITYSGGRGRCQHFLRQSGTSAPQ